MRSTSSEISRWILSLLLVAAAPAGAAAQLLDLQTVPLAAGDQFFIAPSRNAGMGAPSIAFTDPLLDPFVNPAKGYRLVESQAFSSPTAYSISNRNGSARTLPIGALLTSERWFGGGVAAIQQIDVGRDQIPWLLIDVQRDPASSNVVLPTPGALGARRSTNKYFQAFLGRRLEDSGLAVAASVTLADLNRTDGVEELYRNAWDIFEFGHTQDYRLALTGTLSGDRTFEAVLLHNRVDLTQDVTTVSWTLTDSTNFLWSPTVLDEAHVNSTRTWGAHVGYVQPLATDWRIGGALTVNRKLHPEIPTYDLLNVRLARFDVIPRDPGESWASSIGVGLAYEAEPVSFALDLAYEPAVSNTWGDAEADTVLANGTTLLAGGHTVDNRFVFSNARIHAGFDRHFEHGGVQLGLRVHHVDYRLDQENHLLGTTRTQTEQWTEWTPTWGLRLTWSSLELRYTGSASSASHFPWFGSESVLEVDMPAVALQDVLAPPTGALVVPGETVVTHRLAVSVPIR